MPCEDPFLLDVAWTFLSAGIDHLLGAGAPLLIEQFPGKGMFRCEDNRRGAEDRVHTRREDPNAITETLQPEIDFRTFRAADPVPLHRQHAFRPFAFELFIDVAQQFLGVISNFPEPLLERAQLHSCRFVAPAAPVHHLLVRQNSTAFRAPVEQRLLAIRQPALEHFQEEPLVPPVVFRLATRDFEPPVVGESHAVHLPFHRGDVGQRPLAWMAATLDGGILRRQAEGIPAHRVLHVVPAHPHVSRQGVADRIVAHVAHVKPAAGIGEHLDHVILGRGGMGIGTVKLRVFPAFVPLQFDLAVVVRDFRHRLFRVSRFFWSSPSFSTGVSRIKALERNLGWVRMRRKPSRPI